MTPLRLLASGLSVTQIAAQLHRSVTTVSRQKTNSMRKMGLAMTQNCSSSCARRGSEVNRCLAVDAFARHHRYKKGPRKRAFFFHASRPADYQQVATGPLDVLTPAWSIARPPQVSLV